jgi:peptide/nickel transport system substrate-binding protein
MFGRGVKMSTRKFATKNRFLYVGILIAIILILTACAPQVETEPAEPVIAPEEAVEEPAVDVPEEAAEQPAVDVPEEEEVQEEVSQFMVESFRAAVISDESTLNPFTYVTGDPGWNLLMLQYDSLFTMGLDGEPYPWLVTDWALSDDGLSYTLELRQDVTWNDGTPMTADDVKFTFDYFVLNAVGRFARDIREFDSAEVVDEYTVVINLGSPNPGFVRSAFADVPVIPQHIWETIEDPQNHQFDTATNVGTGPYVLMDYTPDQFYRFEANENYFAGMPTVGELVVIKFADEAGTQAAFRTNEVDMIFRIIPPEQIDLLGMVDGVSIVQGPQFTTQMLIMNYDVEPFNLREVRQAMAYAIDRQDLIDTVYLGAATLGSNGWIHPDSPFFNDQVVTEYNLDKAVELLESVGIVDSNDDGVREYNGTDLVFELITPSGNAIRLRLAELIKEMLGNIGMTVNVASVEQTTWEDMIWPEFDITFGRSYELGMWGWSAPVQADVFRAPELVHSDPGVGFLNLTGAASDEIDRISDELAASQDPVVRAELVKELQLAIAEEMPFIVFAYPDGNYAYWSSVYDNLAFIAGQGVVNKLSFLPESARP